MTNFAPVFVKAIYAILFIGLLSGCDGYSKLVKNGTPQEKLEAAKKYYNEKNYLKAQPLFEDLINAYYGRPEREEIYFYLAYTHYGISEYMIAGYRFTNFAETYSLSPRREEASYMAAVCAFHRAMEPELDQTPTKTATNKLQAFINQYPNSKFVSEANDRIDELRQRLLIKAYDNAKLYYHLGYYNSAVVACNNALDDYPDIINREELNYIIVASNFEYAKKSIEIKQLERYLTTKESVATYYAQYPKGEYYAAVKRIEEKTLKEIEDLTPGPPPAPELGLQSSEK
jgi:outer membrane protein assembly factor BamD